MRFTPNPHCVFHMRLALHLTLCLLLLVPRISSAEVPPERKVNIFLTALGFNRTLASAPFGIVLGIFGDCPTGEAFLGAEKNVVNGKPISIVKATKLTYAYLDGAAINVVYLCKAAAADVELLAKVAPRLSITIIADDPALVETVALMGVRSEDGNPRLRLNMKAAREGNLEFDPRILGAAEVAVK